MIQKRDIHMHPLDSSTFMTIVTIGFYSMSVIGDIQTRAISAITWQGLAGIMAVLAATSTLVLNLYRFYNEYKKNKINKKE
jgi:hypothetical protein